MQNRQYSGPLIDAHQHLWTLRESGYPWLRTDNAQVTAVGSLDAIRRDYLIEDYLEDIAAQNVMASVHIEALHEDPLSEIAWLETLDKSRNIAVRYVSAGDLASAEFHVLLDCLKPCRRVVAVRSILSWHPNPALRFVADPECSLNPAWRRGVELLARRGLMLELMMYPYQAAQVQRLAREFPDLWIVINHCGSPIDRDQEGLSRWEAGLALIAQEPNVLLKVSNPGAYLAAWTDTDVIRLIRKCIDTFGHARVMFGTDLPVASLHMRAVDIFRLMRAALCFSSTAEQEQFFFTNAKRVYGL